MKYYIIVINETMQIGIMDTRTLDEFKSFFNRRMVEGNKIVELNCTSYKNQEFKSYPLLFNLDKLVSIFEVTEEQFIDYFSQPFDFDLLEKNMKEGATCETI